MIGEVIWHSLKWDGTITQYDIRFGRKVIKGIPAGLVEAKHVKEHKHEARIIRGNLKEMLEFSHADIVQYLQTQAMEYHKDRSLGHRSIKELLQDDFLDNVGHQVSIDDYNELIDRLSYPTVN